MMRLAALLTAALVAAPALGQSDPALLARSAANDLERAQIALQDAEGARDRVAALTQVIRAYEEGLQALREGLRRARIRETAIRQRFDAESGRLSQLLGVLQAIQATQGPALLLHPSGPVDTARAGMVLAEVTPALRAEAEALRATLEEVAVLRGLQESALDTLQTGLAGVQRARTDLAQAISDRRDLPRRFLSDPEALRRLIESAETLEGFASGLAALAPEEDGPLLPRFSDARGQLPLPVTGRVLRRFGETDAAGITRPGLVIATAPRALVTTPWPATIRYRGPLLDYGNVMILEPGSDYLLVLAGMAEVYGADGEVLPAGAPVGLMGGTPPDAASFLAASGTGTGTALPETLYMELREGGAPVDPAPWFTTE